tara:strand:+ start:35 stop:496 length:462 start_codon:yes stop_codon:yes gene_type:complete
MGSIGGAFGFRDDLVPLFDKKMEDEGGMVPLHILFERLDARHEFDAMLAMLNEKDENGYMKMGEFLACHVKKSNMSGFWNCLHLERGIKLLIDIMPIAGARSVMITNLVKRTDLNNKTGVVLGLKDDRFAVRIKASDCVVNVLVHASNLVALD